MQPDRDFLCHFHAKGNITRAAAAAATALIEQDANVFKYFGAVINQPAYSKLAACFLICSGKEYHVAVQCLARGMQIQKGDQLCNSQTLHVACAAAVKITIF